MVLSLQFGGFVPCSLGRTAKLKHKERPHEEECEIPLLPS